MSQGKDGEQKGRGLDEEALREWVLKAYHEKALESEEHAQLLDAVRLLLSGATSRYSSLSYYFEGDPESSLGSFARQINEVSEDLAATLLDQVGLRVVAQFRTARPLGLALGRWKLEAEA